MKRKLQEIQNFESPPDPKDQRPNVLQKKKSMDFFPQRFFSEEEKINLVIEGQSGEISIADLCEREKITPENFMLWSEEVLSQKASLPKIEQKFDEDDKYRIVLEGMNGEFNIAEICKRENITQEQFLQWSHEFLQMVFLKSNLTKGNINGSYEKRNQIRKHVGEEGLRYFESYLSLNSPKTLIFKDLIDFSHINENEVDHIIFIKRINDLRHINKFFEKVNQKLEVGGIFIGCLETLSARTERKKVTKIPLINNMYFGIEFILKRILPKLSLTKSLYFDMTKGKDRLLSKAEGLGRLVCCGFKIMDYKTINGLVYFVVQKEKEPTYDLNPSYGPIYAMPRLGKNGKIIKVYKFRTMHPYSEYLQDYVIRAHGYAETGKPADDFRIPTWGKIMRKYWLDELPQLYNFLKGDLKLIGIRPVSARYFQDIPKEMQKLRLTQKPGCIPPYVALNRSGNVMSVLQAEKEYLEEKIRNPFTTDTKYFFKALYNIIIEHKRSA